MARVGPVDSDPQPPDRPVDLTSDDPLAALQRGSPMARSTKRSARSRRRWLEKVATEEATLGGVLLDLAERGRPVIVRTLAGQRHRADHRRRSRLRRRSRPRLGDTLMPTTRIATVQPAPGDDLPAGDRRHDVVLAFGDALMELAAERPNVMVGAGDETFEANSARPAPRSSPSQSRMNAANDLHRPRCDRSCRRPRSLTTSFSFDEIVADAPGIDTRRSGRHRGTG